MYRLLLRLSLRLYPSAWRARYGDELVETAAALDAGRERSRIATLLGILGAATRARIDDIADSPPNRGSVGLGGATLAAVVAAVVLLSAGTFNDRSGAASIRSHESIGRQRLAADVLSLCGPTTAGKHVTFVEMNSTTGQVVAKATRRCAKA
jgi:hypothetical protein